MRLFSHQTPESDVDTWRLAVDRAGTLDLGVQIDHHNRPASGSSLPGLLVRFTEIRHFFVGGDIRLDHMSDAEFYTYSLIWLLSVIALMLLGI